MGLATTCFPYCLAALLGAAVPLAMTWVDVSESSRAIELALGASVGMWVVGVGLYRFRYGAIDWFAPPVGWLGLFILSSFSRLFLPYMLYDPGIRPYLVLVVCGLAAFLAGYYLKPSQGHARKATSSINLASVDNLRLVKQLAAPVAVLGWCAVGFAKSRQLGQWDIYGHGQFQYGPMYYLIIAGSLLFVPGILIYYYAAASEKRGIPILPVALLLTYAVFRASSGGRMSGLTPVLGVLMVHNYAVRRIRPRSLLLGALPVILFVVAVWAYRTNHFSLTQAKGELADVQAADVAAVCLIDFGSPASIGTNLMRWFPEQHDWLYGRTYLEAIFSLIPGFFFGGSLNRPFLSGGYLYKQLMEGNRFNPNHGYGFSLLGETFINFGYCGPIVVFFGLGYLLRSLYDRAILAPDARRPWRLMPYVMVYLPLFVAIRSDAVGTVKQIVYNLVVFATVVFLWAEAKREAVCPYQVDGKCR